MTTSTVSILMVLFAGVLSGLGPVLIKKGMPFGHTWNKPTPKLLIGIGLYAIAVLTYFFALRGGDLTILNPLSAFNFVWTCLFSKLLLKEKITMLKISGILLILIGLVFIGLGT